MKMNNNIDWEKAKKEFETKGKITIEQNNNFVRDKNEPFILYDPDKKKYYEDSNKNDLRKKDMLILIQTGKLAYY